MTTTRRSVRAAASALLVFLLFAGIAWAEVGTETTWTVKKALKQMDRAAKDHGGITAEVLFEEKSGHRPLRGTGTVKVSPSGKARADIVGDSTRIILLSPPYFYFYRSVDETVEVILSSTNPDMIAQYALLGFTPSGSVLKGTYDLTLVGEETRDDRQVLHFELSPKSKETRRIIPSIRLWVDLENWLPMRLEVLHGPSGILMTLRFQDVTTGQSHPDDLFLPKWPEGTRVVNR